MKSSKYILVPLILFTFWSCNDILDTKPQQSISQNKALNTSANVKKILIGAYSDLGNGNVYGGRMYLLPDLLGLYKEVQYDGSQPPPGEMLQKNISVANGFVTNLWLDSYQTVNIANNIISALEVVDKSDRDRVEGEAKFIRAIVYFQLVRLFAKDYSDGDPSQNMGVPLILKATKKIGKNLSIPRSSVEKVYNQVISDLKDAESKLKKHSPSYIYADKYSATAFLTRVYLQQRAYKKARNEANEVIENGPYSLVKNYADEFNNSDFNTSEDIFAMQVSKQNGTNTLFSSYASTTEGGSKAIIVHITKAHLNLYKSDDERRNLFYKDNIGRVSTGKWKNQYGNVNVIRLAEMYLDRAECNKRLGTKVGATPTQDVNTIRNRAGLKDVSSVTLDDILAQRHIELAFEGHFLFDLKRTEKSVEGIPWDSPKLVFPIPQREIEANPKLKQNEGY